MEEEKTSNQTEKYNLNKYFECEGNFRNRNELMMQNKAEHIKQCKPCVKYMKNDCTCQNTCWYPHIQNFHTKITKTLGSFFLYPFET